MQPLVVHLIAAARPNFVAHRDALDELLTRAGD
jgi:hypothetical protein